MPRHSDPPRLQRFPAAKQRRMDALLDKNSEGTISARERAQLEALVAEVEKLTIANGRKLAEFAEQQSTPPRLAVPVTVWVSPSAAK